MKAIAIAPVQFSQPIENLFGCGDRCDACRGEIQEGGEFVVATHKGRSFTIHDDPACRNKVWDRIERPRTYLQYHVA